MWKPYQTLINMAKLLTVQNRTDLKIARNLRSDISEVFKVFASNHMKIKNVSTPQNGRTHSNNSSAICRRIV